MNTFTVTCFIISAFILGIVFGMLIGSAIQGYWTKRLRPEYTAYQESVDLYKQTVDEYKRAVEDYHQQVDDGMAT